MKRILVQSWFVILLLFAVNMGLLLPVTVQALTQWIAPEVVVTFALLSMALTMPSRNVASELKKPWAALWAVAVSYGLVPALALGLGELAPIPDVRVGLVIAASVPCTIASSILWTRMAGGNDATALVTVVASTLTSWLATTAWLANVTSADVHIPAMDMMRKLVLTLIVPMIIGQGARMSPVVADLCTRHKPTLSILAQLLILAVVMKASSNVGLQVAEGRAEMTAAVVAISGLMAVGLHVLALSAGFWTSRWWGIDRPRQIAVAISCSQKTLPVSLFLYQEYFREDFPLAVVPFLFYHVGQLVLDTFIADKFLKQKDK